jgi:hypothetical protein
MLSCSQHRKGQGLLHWKFLRVPVWKEPMTGMLFSHHKRFDAPLLTQVGHISEGVTDDLEHND